MDCKQVEGSIEVLDGVRDYWMGRGKFGDANGMTSSRNWAEVHLVMRGVLRGSEPGEAFLALLITPTSCPRCKILPRIAVEEVLSLAVRRGMLRALGTTGMFLEIRNSILRFLKKRDSRIEAIDDAVRRMLRRQLGFRELYTQRRLRRKHAEDRDDSHNPLVQ